MKKVAIIDLGSNSVRMNIAKINSNGTTEIISQNKRMVRLSQGMGDDMNLKVTPMYRTIAALSEFNDIIKENGVTDVTAIATAAVRKASNRDYFLKEVKSGLGLDISVISGEMEAVYDYLGVMSNLEISDCLIVDIGGGSVEIILVKNSKMANKTSIPIGAVSISEKFFSEGESKESIDRAANLVDSYINAVNFLDNAKGFPIIGLGGCNRVIAKVDINGKNDNKMIHGHKLSAARVFEIYNMIEGKSLEERELIDGIGKEKADIVVGGMLPIISIINKTGSQSLIVSDSGVRDGILFEKMAKTVAQIINSCRTVKSDTVDTPASVNKSMEQTSVYSDIPQTNTSDISKADTGYEAIYSKEETSVPISPMMQNNPEFVDEAIPVSGYDSKTESYFEDDIKSEDEEMSAYELLFQPKFDD